MLADFTKFNKNEGICINPSQVVKVEAVEVDDLEKKSKRSIGAITLSTGEQILTEEPYEEVCDLLDSRYLEIHKERRVQVIER